MNVVATPSLAPGTVHRTRNEPLRTPLRKIRKREARVGIIGLGYVGQSLAVGFVRAGFLVTGFDIDAKRIEQVNSGISYIDDVSDADSSCQVREGRLRATANFAQLPNLDSVSICAPTPLRKTKDPDLSFVMQAVNEVALHLHRGHLILKPRYFLIEMVSPVRLSDDRLLIRQ